MKKEELKKKIEEITSFWPNSEKENRSELFKKTDKIIIYTHELGYRKYVNDNKFNKGKCNRQTFLQFFAVAETDRQSFQTLEAIESNRGFEYLGKKELQLTGDFTDLDLDKEFKQQINGTKIVICGRKNAVAKDGTIIEIRSTKDSDYGKKYLGGVGNKKGKPWDVHFSYFGMLLAERKMNGENPTLIAWYKGKIENQNFFLELTLNDEGFLICDGEKIGEYNFFDSIEKLKELEWYILKGQIPPKDYEKITSENAQKYFEAGIIQSWEKDQAIQGKEMFQWACRECNFRTFCHELEEQ